MLKKVKTVLRVYNETGLSGVRHFANFRLHFLREKKKYQEWIRLYDNLTQNDISLIKKRIEKLKYKPLISVLMPVYNIEEKWLRKAIESVQNQIYTNWEFCIADDCSSKPHIKKILNEYAENDSRIKVVFRESNGHISAASNSALELVTGEFTALLDHDDEFSKHALYMVAEEVNTFPETDMIYSDEDLIDEKGKRYEPKFKPDWSPDLLYSLNLITHLSVYRTSILRNIGGFRIGYEGSQDYDLALRFNEQVEVKNIRHIPHILYHWRAIPGSVAYNPNQKNYAHERARLAINSHFERSGIDAISTKGVYELHRPVFAVPSNPPQVSLILFSRQHSVTTYTNRLSEADYNPFEVILVGQKSDDNKFKYVFDENDSFYSSLNKAVQIAEGSVLCFLNTSTVPLKNDWLKELTSHALRNDIGAVGAKIYYPDTTIKHAGFLLGINNGIGISHHHFPKISTGNFVRLQVTQNFCAVSIDCLTIKKELFESVEGFDTTNFPNQYGDVDLCLRLKEKGFRNVWTPWAEFTQPEDYKSNDEDELNSLKKRWKPFFDNDPYFNPNFSNETDNFSLAIPPRIKKVWKEND